MLYENGARFEGKYVNGVRQGPGVDTFPDGARAEGEYLSGKPHGRWLYTGSDGTRQEQQFDNGALASVKVRQPELLHHWY